MSMQTNTPAAKSKRGGLYWLFLIPFIATLFPFFFNYREPSIIGLPFFYWYQLVWIPITVLLTWLVYRVEE
jgi:Protein of unknown function (DUF3311)